MLKKLEQQRAELEGKLARLRTKERACATRELIVLGAVCRKRLLSHPSNARALLDWLTADVTRDSDKEAIAKLMEVARNVVATAPGPSTQTQQQSQPQTPQPAGATASAN